MSTPRQNLPVAVYSPHPLMPSRDRQIIHATFALGETLGEYLERTGIADRIRHRPVLVTINGLRVPRSFWQHCYPKPGTLIQVQALVHGGDGKNPIATVLMIALLVVVAVFQPELLVMFGPYTSMASAAIVMGGGMIINAAFPPPNPQLSQPGTIGQESPTYSLSGGSNRARPYEPMPVIMGTHRIFPDAGARTYTEFQGEDQYLYQVFDFGYNDLDLSDYKIGTNPIADYSGVTLQESGADGALTLFPANVDTQAGAELVLGAAATVRTSSLNTTALAIEITGSLYAVDHASGQMAGQAANIELQYREVGSGVWLSFQGDPAIYQIGNASRKPLRITYWRDVLSGQYEVSARFVSAPDIDDPGNTHVAELVWSQLRSYQPDIADYTGRKRVALKIKASGQLNGMVSQLSALVSAKTLMWNGAAWVTAATSNPAWWVLAATRGKFNGTRRVWGGGIPEARINLENNKAFGAWCTSKGLTFNGVFDRQMSVYDMLSAIALCGRGTISLGSNEVVWDAPDQPAVAVFGMSNIKLDTFEIEYSTGQLADEIVATFVNPDSDWQQDVVRVLAPGVTDPVRSRNVSLFGCTSKIEAGHTANLYVAANIHRTKRYRWQMDWEGMPVSRGDVGYLSHDLASYDYSGRLIEGTTAAVLKLERAVPLDMIGSFVTIVKPDGTYATYAVSGGTGDSNTLTLVAPLAFDPGADADHPPYDYRWLYGNTATPGKKIKIEAISIKGYDTVELTAIDETTDYYASEDNPYIHVPIVPVFGNGLVISNLQITEDLVRNGNGFAVNLTFTWEVAGSYSHANIRVGLNGDALQDIGSTFSRRFETIVPDQGTVDVEVAGFHPLFGTGAQSKVTAHYTLIGKTRPPADVTGFRVQFNGPDTLLPWDGIPDVDVDDYEVRRGATWETGVLVGRAKANSLPVEALAAVTTFWIKAFDTSKNSSVNATSLVVTPIAPPSPVLSGGFDAADVKLTWPVPVGGSYLVKHYAMRYGDTWAGGISVGFVDVTTFRALADWSGLRKWWVVAIDVAGNESAPVFIEINVTPPSQPTILSEVIDNNVLLRWTDATQTLPIKHYELRRGDVFATATVIGTISAQFSVVFESVAGTYRYWVVGVDAGGNYGTEGSITSSVAAPPDYVLFENIASDFSGTKTNTLDVDGRLLAMVSTTRTIEQHFTDETWDQPQDQIDAGFPIFIQPGITSGQYAEEIDYGTVLPATKITVDIGTTVVSGSMTIVPTISTKLNAIDAWTDFVGQWSVYATNFRYIKVTLDFAGAGREDLIYVDTLTTRLDVKLKSDAGNLTANSGDAGGTTVSFNVAFVDIQSINGTAQGTTFANVVIDFTDVPNPTDFKVLVFDLAGNRITRVVRWEAKGV